MGPVGVRQQELLRRVLERNPQPTTESLIVQATPAGRGLPETDLVGIPGEELPPRELLRVAASAIADKLISKGIPPEPEPTARPKLKRRYVLAGDPLATHPIREAMIGRGRRPGGSRARAWVLAAPVDRLLAHAWTAACFDSGPPPWPAWLATWAQRDKPPGRADLVTMARKHRDAGRRPTIVADRTQLSAALGLPGPLPEPLVINAAAAEVSRRVANVLGGLVSSAERTALLRTQLLPRVAGATGPVLQVPPEFASYAEAHGRRMAETLQSDGFPVLGDLTVLSSPVVAAQPALDDLAVLDAAISLLASRPPVVPSASPQTGGPPGASR